MRFALLLPIACLSLACSAAESKPRSDDDDDAQGEQPTGEIEMDATVRDASVRDAQSTARDGALSADGAVKASDGGATPLDARTEAPRDATVSQDASDSSYDWRAGDYPPDPRAQTYLPIDGVSGQAGKMRGYKVHVPPTYDPSVPAPVVFALHGWQQNAVMFGVDGSGWMDKSDQEGFVLVMPNGIQEDGVGGSWNAGVCCGAAASQRLDDVGLIRAIFADVVKHANIDRGRVYATGMSNGGFMTHRLGCEAADLFVALVPNAGSIGTAALGAIGTNPTPDLMECKPSKPVAVLAIHGTSDGIVPYAGMKPSLDHWAKENGCEATTRPATQPASGGDTTCVTYEGCDDGVEVTGCSVMGGGHCWFGDPSCGTGAPGIGNLFVGNDSNFLNNTDAAWDFFKRFER
jgi:polyhydroxybutyrate depolymerase